MATSEETSDACDRRETSTGRLDMAREPRRPSTSETFRPLPVLSPRCPKTHPLKKTLAILSLTGLLVGIATPNIAQTNPPLSSQQSAELEEAKRLNQQIVQLYRQGQYAAAIPLARRALSIREKVFGPEHPSVATSLNNLAELYQIASNYAAAEPLFRRALSIWEKTLGAEHPRVAIGLNNLASLYWYMGNYPAAESLFQRTLAIQEKVLGSEHTDVARSLNNLAEVYRVMGNYRAAELLFQRAIAIKEKALGAEHPDIARSLNNLAALYQIMGNYRAAEPLFRRASAIWEKAFGAEHPDVAASFNNLALLYRAMGDDGAAEPLLQRAISIWEKALGIEHPDIATSLNNLAALYQDRGDYDAAELLFRRAIAIDENVYGQDHPEVAADLKNLSLLHRAQNDIPRATEFLQRGTDIEEKNLSLIFTAGSESEKRAYMKTLSGTTDYAISLHIQGAPNNPQAARLALTTLLRRKGRILDALTEILDLLHENLTPENQALLDQLSTKRTQLSNLIYNKPENLSPEEYRRQVSTLKAEAEQLESELSRRSAEFRVQSEPVTIEAIQALIPGDTALVEIVQYKPFDPKASYGERWGTPHYAAYILKPTGEPQWVDLGEAKPIDNAVKTFRRGLTNRIRRSRAKITGRALDEMVMQPIRAKLGNTKNILLSPDGQLNLIAFAALVDENGQYLVENYRITYLTTGRDLLRLSISNPAQQPPVVLANPDYDDSDGSSTVAPRTSPNLRTTPEANNTSSLADRSVGAGLANNTETQTNRSNTKPAQSRRSADIENLTFDSLPGTAAEAAVIAPLLENVTLLTETQATENAVKQVQSPSILHIATHGFFLEVDLVAPAANSFEREEGSLVAIQARPGFTPRQQENPLLRSGIVFAGFNNRSSGGEDGVLTALEVANLNLRGTQLVVLSACETGLGEIANGEGVYGLRRALVMAGAESQAISLWKVSDEGTKNLMARYYQRLLRGEGRSEALRQVQLEMLQGEEYSHPFFWGAFIPSGAWTAME
ncbi:tetratricopeptide repeat protein [Lusitaniella coriacea]|uniref:tetratricopeptide repeat protein n=1 Tax=Lusitaniella coriacea TaxID=1983105 RepID=UPI002D2198D3|nr:tetratricopeptide repeat protein [Lusitaniella coriacea]